MSATTMAHDGVSVVEWAPFRLVEGVSEHELLEASETLQRDFLERQLGFVRRELLRGADGQWVDLIHWESEAAVNAVLAAVGQSMICQQYFRLMVMPEGTDPAAGVLHLTRVRAY